jgi:hypothetical protein
MELAIIYIEASYLVGVYSLEGKCDELYGGLPCIYMITFWGPSKPLKST